MGLSNYDVYGLKVSNFKLSEIESLFLATINENKCIVLFGHSLGYLTLFKKHPSLYSIINSYDVLVCDGTQFNWYCILNGFKIETVISIPDMTTYTLEFANRNGYSVLLFGAKEEINKKATTNLQKKYPNAIILPGINGYYLEGDELEIVEKINSHKPQILLIGISTPIKEFFVSKYKNVLGANIIIPCGGMIDVYSGYTRQSPHWLKKAGLATPFRIIQEPRRLFALHTWMIFEIICKLFPITFYYRCVLQRKTFNLIDKYINRRN